MWIKLLGLLIQFLIKVFENWDKKSNTTKPEEVKQPVVIEKPIEEPVFNPEPVVKPTPIVQKPEIVKPNIIKSLLVPNQYVQDSKFIPKQIVLHHTAGGTAKSTINYWSSNKERIATHFIIDRDGSIYQCVPLEKSWAYHLWVSSPGNKIDRKYKKLGSKYDAQSIGIEIAAYGPCTLHNGQFLNTYGRVMSNDSIDKLDKPFRGYTYFEKYSSAQIKATEELLLYLLKEFPLIAEGLKKDYADQFDISEDALNMKPGVYTHTNYRTDKSDIFCFPAMIQMLNSLKDKV